MRSFEISIGIKAPSSQIWEALEDLDGYRSWSSFIPFASGDLSRDKTIHMRARYREEPVSIHVDEVVPGKRLVLSRDLFHRRLVHLTHYFELNELGNGETRFAQRWEGRGLLIPFMWRKLSKGMGEFEAFNADLRNHIEGCRQGA